MDYKKIKRIAIIGSPGAGKSTMAKKLGEVTGIEYFHLDKYYHNSGWVPKPKEEFRKIVSELVLKEEWIMDGNYRGTLDLRAERADLIIFLNYSSVFSIYRIYKRIFKSKLGRENRTDIPEDCYEEWLPIDFTKWTWNYNKTCVPDTYRILSELNVSESVLKIFKRVKDSEKFIKEFSKHYENK